MKILLVYPYYPTTFWSFRNAMKFIDRKASFPPLGLMTVAAMLPESWDKRLVDMNVRSLEDDDLLWADYVFISAMITDRRPVPPQNFPAVSLRPSLRCSDIRRIGPCCENNRP